MAKLTNSKVEAFIANNLNKEKLPVKRVPANKGAGKDNILTVKQRAFVEKIIRDGFAPTQAYLSVYKGASKATASSGASALMKKPAIKAELASQANELRHLANVPKHYIIQELKELMTKVKGENNFKYQIEVLEMINKMMGYYTHTTTNVQVSLKGEQISFGGWNPDNDIVDITPPSVSQALPTIELIEDQTDSYSISGSTYSGDTLGPNDTMDVPDDVDMPF